jgi:transposase
MTARAKYTLEFKLEAVRLVAADQSIAATARTLGVVDQTLFDWVKAFIHRAPLTGVADLGAMQGAESELGGIPRAPGAPGQSGR